ncbi:DsrE family protein [Desulfoscipio geothermicus]|uniref:Uncharacterized protein n=1 Tax=Desulfoscipio geothermicus DSM 3669 TaxID=1121426 RepID=A0A1I6CS69_9FIRM|nr:DsrE family protein [Desulfoscipio geothermicus]SFQ95967.1 hypothetical protein SAMN05660706_101285 [Desulfoscipio geothermicus DSM 3669]
MGKLKVLFHLNEPEKWQGTFSSIINFVKDVGQENADIEVVANGAAVSAFSEKCRIAGGSGETSTSCGKATGELYEEMNKLAQMGIRFVACRNALRMHSLDENMLPPFITVVPAGITEIAKKQAEGYAYIKT